MDKEKYLEYLKTFDIILTECERSQLNQLKDFSNKSWRIQEQTRLSWGSERKTDGTKEKTKKSPRQNKANKTLNHSMQNMGLWGRFVQFLTYKAKKIGKRVMRIGKHRTTQVCAKCGRRVKRDLSERDIICDCGHRMDRDLNSAINIMVKFLKSNELSHQPSLKEKTFLHKWNGFFTTHSPKIHSKVNA